MQRPEGEEEEQLTPIDDQEGDQEGDFFSQHQGSQSYDDQDGNFDDNAPIGDEDAVEDERVSATNDIEALQGE